MPDNEASEGLAASLFQKRHRDLMRAFDGLPGPTPKFPLGNALDLVREPIHEVMLDYARRYGNLVVFWVAGRPNLLVNEPHLIDQVLVRDHPLYYKDTPVDALLPIVRSSLFIANDPEWKPKRVHHPFSVDWLQDFFRGVLPTLRDEARRGISDLAQAGGDADLYDRLSRLAFALFSLGNVGFKLDGRRYHQYMKIMNVGARRMRTNLPTLDPTFWLARDSWYAYFEKLVAERRHNPDSQRTDLLSLSVRHGTELAPDRLRDELSTNFMAGSNPVATTLTSALVLLTRHPEVAASLRDEVRGLGHDYSLDDLLQAELLDRVVLETLRLYSTVPVIGRAILPDSEVELDGRAIPQRTNLLISSWALHQTPQFWPEPERFDPSRFEREPAPGTYMPFGWGRQECVGKPWALFCLKLLLTAILTDWRVTIEQPEKYSTRYWTGLFLPKGRVEARVSAID